VSAAELAELASNMLDSPPTLAAIGPVRKLPDISEIAERMAGRMSAVRA
jgi:hypothetical protein